MPNGEPGTALCPVCPSTSSRKTPAGGGWTLRLYPAFRLQKARGASPSCPGQEASRPAFPRFCGPARPCPSPASGLPQDRQAPQIHRRFAGARGHLASLARFAPATFRPPFACTSSRSAP